MQGPDSATATIRMNALHSMKGEDGFEPLALPYCFCDMFQTEGCLVGTDSRSGWSAIRGAITSTMVALASIKWRLQ